MSGGTPATAIEKRRNGYGLSVLRPERLSTYLLRSTAAVPLFGNVYTLLISLFLPRHLIILDLPTQITSIG